jgi:hypothetical protein
MIIARGAAAAQTAAAPSGRRINMALSASLE